MEKTLLKRKVVILPANKKVVIGDFVIASYDERAIEQNL